MQDRRSSGNPSFTQEITGSNPVGGILGKHPHTRIFTRGSVAARMVLWPSLWPKREQLESVLRGRTYRENVVCFALHWAAWRQRPRQSRYASARMVSARSTKSPDAEESLAPKPLA